jgi:ABC-type multidrug transport system ATPase subunit
MVTRPSLLFLDEPTSGLDASAALAVVSLLKQFSDSGMMIM